jgi:hypothetical protein
LDRLFAVGGRQYFELVHLIQAVLEGRDEIRVTVDDQNFIHITLLVGWLPNRLAARSTRWCGVNWLSADDAGD